MFDMRTTYKISWCMRVSEIDIARTNQCMDEHERGVGGLIQKAREAGQTILGMTSIQVGRSLNTGGKYTIITVIYHEIAEHAKICKKCGTPNLATSNFCLQCGADIALKH